MKNIIKFKDLVDGKKCICVVGLGYVGLPLAIKLSQYFKVIGLDLNKRRIEELKKGFDSTHEVSEDELKGISIEFSDDPSVISKCGFIIVAVPTPIDKLKNPDLSYLKSASQLVGKYMKKGSIIVYESTVYPGATEEICVPELERSSGLKWKKDFWVGYSPERINPGDKNHTLEKVVKIVSGDTEESLEVIVKVYETIVKAGVYKAKSIKVAEAAKVLENIQRDVNIAVVNEAALIFKRLGIDTREVLDAASTKWNFLRFEPGLVGGHCIPVDPYYLIYKAILHNYVPELFLSARAVNESIPKFIAHEIVKLLVQSGKKVKDAKVLVLGITFKENVPDIRNSKIYELIKELKEFFVVPYIYDPVAHSDEVLEEFGLSLINKADEYTPYDAIILAAKHKVFLEEFDLNFYKKISSEPRILVDIKGVYSKEKAEKEGFIYWRL